MEYLLPIPDKIVSDNGPQFTSSEFKRYCEERGITHRKITPYWSQRNAEVERFFHTMEKAGGRNWRNELFIFLLNYRTTSHCTTGVSPARLLMGRQLRTKIPELGMKKTSKILKQAIKTDYSKKEKIKSYADMRSHAKESGIVMGDQVLLRWQNKRRDKLSTTYDPVPYEVLDRKGPSAVISRNGRTIMRNTAHLRKIPGHAKSKDKVTLESDSEEEFGGPLEDNEDETNEAAPERAPGRPQRVRRPPPYMVENYVLD